MKIIVNEHKLEIIKEPVNEKEINITKCEFEFADTIPEDYAKKAFFTYKGTTYEQLIQNNECDIPYEALDEKGQVEIGVIVYKTENDEYIQMYNPSPAYFETWKGSLKEDVENSSSPTPSEIEQIESQLANKQDFLVSGENIKTINEQSILGSGNIHIEGGGGGTSDYEELTNKPLINNVGLIGNKSLSDLGIQPEGDYALESDIPTELSELTADSTHRLVTDTEKTTWNSKSDFSGDYDDLTNKPELFSGDYNDLTNKPTIPTVPTNVSAFTNDAGYLTSYTETDPVFSNSAASGITSSDITAWNGKQDELTAGDNITINNNVISASSGGVIVNSTNASEQSIVSAVNDEYQKFVNGEPYSVYYQGNVGSINTIIQMYFYYTSSSQVYLAGLLPSNYTSSADVYWLRALITCGKTGTDITSLRTNAVTYKLLAGNSEFITSGNAKNYTVSGDYNPAHKKYVDDSVATKQDIIQYETMPTADATTEGKIVQYTGATDSTYTNGYFYIGTEDSGSYSWENIEVQPSSGGGTTSVIVNSSNYSDADIVSAVNDEYQKFLNGEPYNVWWQGNSTGVVTLIPMYFYYSSGAFYQPYLAGLMPSNYYSSGSTYWIRAIINCYKTGTNVTSLWPSATAYRIMQGNSAFITSGNTDSYTVTQDYNPAHKKYVDEKPTTWSGYDATKTQVLKNINGTLTWVDES